MSKPIIITLSGPEMNVPDDLRLYFFNESSPPEGYIIIQPEDYQVSLTAVQIREIDPEGKIAFPNGKYEFRPQIRNTSVWPLDAAYLEFYAFHFANGKLMTRSLNKDIFRTALGKRVPVNNSVFLSSERFGKDAKPLDGGLGAILFRHIAIDKLNQILPINMLLQRSVPHGKDQWSLHRLKL